MKTKLPLYLAALMVVVLAAAAAPLYASCSGDDCGCGTGQAQCIADCPPGSGHVACVTACVHVSVCCAEECCGACTRACGCIIVEETSTLASGSLLRSSMSTNQANSHMDFRTWDSLQTGASCQAPKSGR
jgi:hypothetical protein